jgi:hypothetical protein
MRMTAKVLLYAAVSSITSACAVPPEPDKPGDQLVNESEPATSDGAPVADGEGVAVSDVITPLAASTNSLVLINGTRVVEAWFNRTGGDSACSGPCFALLDASCDLHPVYVEYQINDGSWTRKSNNGTCGTTLRIPLPGGSYNIRYHACVDVQFGSDQCPPRDTFDHN